MDALAASHDAAMQMIDTSILRVHQHAALMTANGTEFSEATSAEAAWSRWRAGPRCGEGGAQTMSDAKFDLGLASGSAPEKLSPALIPKT
jgi:hypothetical protein